jgi:hypothetical protein
MSTTLATARQELSRQIADYWASTTTTAGNAGGTTYIDTALMAKANDWVSDAPQEVYDLITSVSSGSNLDNERKLYELDSTTGTITSLAHTGQVLVSTGYEIHRLFSASEKRRALIHACKAGFPYIFKQVRDTSLTVGNWLRNGDLESNWLTTATNTYWVAATSTLTQYTTAPYFTRGATSMRITGSAGSVYQSNTENVDLMDLAGNSVTFEADVWNNIASDTRLSIYDGTTTTYSSYHSGGSSFERLSVTATIADSPASVKFSIHRGATSTVYADDFRVIGPSRDKLYIGDLGLALNYPHEIRQSADSSIDDEPWQLIREYEIGSDGYLYLGEGSDDYRLRICGIGYLDFLASGVSSTAWTATVDIDSPQTEILIAEAVMYLYIQMISPNYTSGDRDSFAKILQYWEAELDNRRQKFGMKAPLATVKWGSIGGTGYKSQYGRTQY